MNCNSNCNSKRRIATPLRYTRSVVTRYSASRSAPLLGAPRNSATLAGVSTLSVKNTWLRVAKHEGTKLRDSVAEFPNPGGYGVGSVRGEEKGGQRLAQTHPLPQTLRISALADRPWRILPHLCC